MPDQQENAAAPVMDIQTIMANLPHRYPFLLIDRIVESEDLKTAVGIKQLTENEAFFQGHFPDQPEMPYSLLLEAMAQVGATIIMSTPEARGNYILFAALDKAEFGRPAVPGETLVIEATMLNYRRDTGKTLITCRVDDEQLATAEFTFAMAKGIEG